MTGAKQSKVVEVPSEVTPPASSPEASSPETSTPETRSLERINPETSSPENVVPSRAGRAWEKPEYSSEIEEVAESGSLPAGKTMTSYGSAVEPGGGEWGWR